MSEDAPPSENAANIKGLFMRIVKEIEFLQINGGDRWGGDGSGAPASTPPSASDLKQCMSDTGGGLLICTLQARLITCAARPRR